MADAQGEENQAVTKEEYAEYLQTPHWQGLKRDLYAQRGRVCMACGGTKRIQAHHVFYRHPITECTTDDLMPVCRTCHQRVHASIIHSECLKLADNDARRLHVILAIQAQQRIPKPQIQHPIRRIRRPRVIDRYSPEHLAQRRRTRLKRKRLQRETNRLINARYAISPGSPADIYQKQLDELKRQRQEEDRKKVNSAPRNSTAPKMPHKQACRERYIAALNRNGFNVKPTVFY